mmetsp:Transcript_85079/g.166450  ORF Transcript_85079/g.166450 Transcript_85079/m.166450 type:complete len:241 (+) Transcript_85079:125-847(+)
MSELVSGKTHDSEECNEDDIDEDEHLFQFTINFDPIGRGNTPEVEYHSSDEDSNDCPKRKVKALKNPRNTQLCQHDHFTVLSTTNEHDSVAANIATSAFPSSEEVPSGSSQHVKMIHTLQHNVQEQHEFINLDATAHQPCRSDDNTDHRDRDDVPTSSPVLVEHNTSDNRHINNTQKEQNVLEIKGNIDHDARDAKPTVDRSGIGHSSGNSCSNRNNNSNDNTGIQYWGCLCWRNAATIS